MLDHLGESPELVEVDGHQMWRFADGRLLPLIRGASDGDGDGGDGAGDEGSSGGEGDGDGDGSSSELIDKLRRHEKESLKQAKEAEARAAKAEQRVKELEAESMGEKEKIERERDELKERVADLEGQVRSGADKATLVAAAKKAGARNPELVARVVDHSSIKRDDDGSISNAKDLIDSAKSESPELFEPKGSADQGARTGGKTTGSDMDARIRKAAGRG